MTFSEALEAMKQGYKVRRASWSTGYIYLKNNETIIDDGGITFEGIIIDNLLATDWEIYNEPKPEPQFEIGELVMMRDNNANIWRPEYFAREGKSNECNYQSMTGAWYVECAKFDKDIVFTNKPVKK